MQAASAQCQPPGPSLADFLSCRTAGQLVGLSGRTVRRLHAAGEFVAAVQVPGLRGMRFRRADVLAWLAQL